MPVTIPLPKDYWWLELAAMTLMTSVSTSDIITVIENLPLNENFVQINLASRKRSHRETELHETVTTTCKLIFSARSLQPIDRTLTGNEQVADALAKAFARVQFRDWVSEAIGNRVDVVDDLMKALRFFRESRHWNFKGFDSVHPLTSWICQNGFEHPFSILERLFEDSRETLGSPKSWRTVFDRLNVLRFRWENLKSEPTVARLRHLPSGFEILTFCHREPTPLQVSRQAELLTTRDLAAFCELSISDLDPARTSSLNLYRVCSHRQRLHDEVVECTEINPRWSSLLMLLVQALERRHNLNSASAILEALAIQSSGVSPIAFDMPLSIPLGSHHAAILSHRQAALANPAPFLLTNGAMRASQGPALFFRQLSIFLVEHGDEYRYVPPGSANLASEKLSPRLQAGHVQVAPSPIVLTGTSQTAETAPIPVVLEDGTLPPRLRGRTSFKKLALFLGMSRAAQQ